VVIRSGAARQIRVEAEYSRAQVEVKTSGGRVAVRTISRRGSGEVDYSITVPNGTAVEINGISTDVDIAGVCGEAEVNVISGDVTLDCGVGDLRLQTVSGDVEVSGARGPLEVGSTSGDVVVRGARGPVNAHNVSGDIVLEEVDAGEIGAQTVSGDIAYSGPVPASAHYRFEAHSGDVSLRLAGDLNATFTVSTYSGDFDSEIPIVLDRLSGREWQFTQGNGSARVVVRSFSGTIYLRRGAGAGRGREE
jgi:DUF4097 and DUF4098 domain-containing protein YvlB